MMNNAGGRGFAPPGQPGAAVPTQPTSSPRINAEHTDQKSKTGRDVACYVSLPFTKYPLTFVILSAAEDLPLWWSRRQGLRPRLDRRGRLSPHNHFFAAD